MAKKLNGTLTRLKTDNQYYNVVLALLMAVTLWLPTSSLSAQEEVPMDSLT